MLYWETFDVLESLVDGEAKQMLIAIRQYSQYGALPDFSDSAILNTLWLLIRPKLDADAERYERIRDARVEAGRKGGLARASNAKQIQANESNVTFAKQIKPTTTTSTTTTATTTTDTTSKTKAEADRGCRGEENTRPLQQGADSLGEIFKFPTASYKPMDEETFIRERDRKLQMLDALRG